MACVKEGCRPAAVPGLVMELALAAWSRTKKKKNHTRTRECSMPTAVP